MPTRELTPQEVQLEERRASLTARILRLPAGSSERRRLEARQAEICRALLVLEVRPVPKAQRRPVQSAAPPPEDDNDEVQVPRGEWWKKW